MVQVSKVGPPPVESCDIDWISKSTLRSKPWALMDLTDAVKLMSLWVLTFGICMIVALPTTNHSVNNT